MLAEQDTLLQKTYDALEVIPEIQIPTNNNNELFEITKTSTELSRIIKNIVDLKNPTTITTTNLITPPTVNVRFNANVDVERLEETDSVCDSNEPDDLASVSVFLFYLIPLRLLRNLNYNSII